MPPYTPENDEGVGRRQLAAAALFLGLAFTSLFMPPDAQRQVGATLRASVLQPFILVQEGLSQNRLRSHEADAMRMRYDSVVGVLSSQSSLVEENVRLRELLELSSRATPEYRAANVVRSGTQGSESMYLLDIGSRDGVRVNSPVVGRDGLVGVVREVRANSALGVDWTHPDFRVSAMTADGEVYGMIETRRGEYREDDRLLLNGAPYHVAIEDGALIVTSGLGGIYPRGIPLGRVHSLAEADAGWRKSYWLEPAVRPGSMTQVLVAVGEVEEEHSALAADGPGQGPSVVDRSDFWPGDTIPLERTGEWTGERPASGADSIRDSAGEG
ncbi:MAG: rod shape-determining protein MreC [Gemmatimonadota bacterium]